MGKTTTDPFNEFMSTYGSDVTVEYDSDTKRFTAQLHKLIPDPDDEDMAELHIVMIAEASNASHAVLKLQTAYNIKHGGPSAKLSKRAREQYEPLTDGQLMTMADGLSGQMDRYARAGDLREALGVARELGRLEIIMSERGIHDAWTEPKMRQAVSSMDELLGGSRDKE